jgi:hypothetical protein
MRRRMIKFQTSRGRTKMIRTMIIRIVIVVAIGILTSLNRTMTMGEVLKQRE